MLKISIHTLYSLSAVCNLKQDKLPLHHLQLVDEERPDQEMEMKMEIPGMSLDYRRVDGPGRLAGRIPGMSLDYVRPKEKQKRELSRHSADKGNLFIVVPVDLDDDAALQKLTVDMLKGYHKKYNLPSSTPDGVEDGVEDQGTRSTPCDLSVSSCILLLYFAPMMNERTRLLCAGCFDRKHQKAPEGKSQHKFQRQVYSLFPPKRLCREE